MIEARLTFTDKYMSHFVKLDENFEFCTNVTPSSDPVHLTKISKSKTFCSVVKMAYLLIVFEDTSWYLSTTFASDLIYPENGFWFAFTKDIHDTLIGLFSTETFTRGSSFLRIKYSNHKDLVLTHVPYMILFWLGKLERKRKGILTQKWQP